jgi:hypothetical protein
MQASHTAAHGGETPDRPSPLRLADPAGALGLPEQLAGRVDGHLAAFVQHMTQGLLAASTAVGLEVMAELMDAEVAELAGPKGKHDPARTGKRHGSQPGTVTLGGRRLAVRRPRARSAGDGEAEHELPLTSYAAFAATDQLAEGIVARMLAGLSTRRYPAGLEPVGEQVDQHAVGTSKSSVSRRFVTATAERLGALLGRRLDDRRWLIVFLDGFGMGEHLLVGALGVAEDGTKVPLGVAEGTTENAAVCTRLVADLQDRGLDPSRGVLFVVDGGKALDKAIRSVFGRKALVQRCRQHRSWKEIMCRFPSLGLAGVVCAHAHPDGGPRSTRHQVRGVVAASERASAALGVGGRGAVAGAWWRAFGCAGGRRQRDDRPQGRG